MTERWSGADSRRGRVGVEAVVEVQVDADVEVEVEGESIGGCLPQVLDASLDDFFIVRLLLTVS